jgi:hypothetical protein
MPLFGKKPIELIVPPDVKSDPGARELVRVWAAHGQQHVSIAAEAWDDPATWGIMLVDLARHIANFYHQERGMDPNAVLLRIKTLFDAEWESPTSDATGGVLK